MAEYELIGADKVLDYMCKKYNKGKKEITDIWVSQFDFLHDCIKNKSRWDDFYYPGVLMRGFGKFYCKKGRIDWLKKRRENENGKSTKIE